MCLYNSWFSGKDLKTIKFNLKKTIGREIKTLRKMHGISGLELGIIIDKSQQQISRYENGSTSIPLETLMLLLYLFNVPPEIFFNRILFLVKNDANIKKTLFNISKSSKIHNYSEYWKTLK